MKKRNNRDNPNGRNIKIIMMYDGNGYAGWQRLGSTDTKPSIQAVLEECLTHILKEEIKIIGSGRTDAGVHALGQVANYYCQSKLPVQEILAAINKVLPEDIAISCMEEAEKDFHSRYSAKAKTYEYRIDQGETQSVFTRKYTCPFTTTLDVAAMKAAANYLIGTHDFKAFSTDRKDNKSTVRTVEAINIRSFHDKNTNLKTESDYSPSFGQNELRITITGNGFLYNMVRIIIGTLLEVGQGGIKPEDIKGILESGERKRAGMTVSSQGLFLVDVKY